MAKKIPTKSKKTKLKLVKATAAKLNAKSAPKKTTTKNPKKSPATTTSKVLPIKRSVTADKAFNLKPLDNRIVVEVEESAKMTAGGLHIPDSVQAAGNTKGKVIAVGTGHMSKKGKKSPLELKVGDDILFADWAGDKLEFNGKSVRILRESDVLGLVD